MTKFPFYPQDVAAAYERYAMEFQFPEPEPVPWVSLRVEFRHAKVALATTAGIRLKSDRPFMISREKGSAEWRQFPVLTGLDTLEFEYDGYDRSEGIKDLNVLLPVERFVEMRERRLFSELHPYATSFVGHFSDLSALRASGRQWGEMLRQSGIDLVFLFPAGLACNQTVCILAREVERCGVSTLVLTTVKEVAQEVRPPRAVFLNFPFGCTFGRAHAISLQRSIVEDLVKAVRGMDKPGCIVELPYRWPTSETMDRS